MSGADLGGGCRGCRLKSYMLFQIELVVKLVVKLHSTQFNYHYLEFVSAAIMNNCGYPGRGVLPVMAYTRRRFNSARKEYLFYASGI